VQQLRQLGDIRRDPPRFVALEPQQLMSLGQTPDPGIKHRMTSLVDEMREDHRRRAPGE